MKRQGRALSWLLALVMGAAIVFYGPGVLIFRPSIPRAHASALSFICASSAASTSTAACTGEQSGDLLLVFAYRSASSTAPTLATSYTAVNTATNSGGGTLGSMRDGWKTAASSTETSGTWTNASHVVMQVFRGQNSSSPIGASTPTGGNNSGTTVVYGATTLSVSDGSSWFAGFAGRTTGDAKMATAPTGMTNKTSAPATTPLAAGHNTNAPTASSWPSTSVTGFSASAKYVSDVIEIKAAPAITVGTSGTHVSSLTIPSTSDYTGGAFTLIRDIASANVTSITLHNSGTVNAQSNLSNLFLFYKQEAVCSATIPAGTTQFNSTAGSFNASGDATVTGTISVGTAQICVYVQLDVGSGAASGDTIKLQITNPSTDVLVSSGSAAPATAVAMSGSIALQPPGPTIDQEMRHGNWFSGGSEQSFFWAN